MGEITIRQPQNNLQLTRNSLLFATSTPDNIRFTSMTWFPLQFSRLPPTSLRRSVAPARSGPPRETATVLPREIRMDRQRQRQSSLSVMNAGDQAGLEVFGV